MPSVNNPSDELFVRGIVQLDDMDAAIEDPEKIAEIRQNLLDGDLYVAKQAVPPFLIEKIKNYPKRIGRSSLPNYVRIEEGCPNSHRINDNDERAYVGGCFHQFSFFPWNQDVFHLFEVFRKIYYLKNLTSNLARDRFLKRKPDDDCIARLSFQFYPRGAGRLNLHADPVDYHQLTVPTLVMSQKGVDYWEGGAYAQTRSGERLFYENETHPGDAIFFNARIPHGVATIDPGSGPLWQSFRGRWMALVAVNKVFDNPSIANSADLTG